LRMNGNPKARPVDANASCLWHGRANLWHSITRCRQRVAYKQLRTSQLGGDQRNAAPHKACITGKHQECRRQYF
jgi:hypothetical protein